MKIGVYVTEEFQQNKYRKNNSFNDRLYAGIGMIELVLNESQLSVYPCGIATVHEYDIVLISITAACDWWPFIAERMRWKSGKYKVIVGGAGVLNVRPFLEFADIFVFGRGENLIVPLIKSIAADDKLKSDSVCYSEDFSINNKYTISQAEGVFKKKILLQNGNYWQETGIGCKNKCFFCAYTWHRKNTNTSHSDLEKSRIMNKAQAELTMNELDMKHPEHWNKNGMIGLIALDGFSERVRRRLNKPINTELFRNFLSGLCSLEKRHKIKLFNLVGTPDEETSDWMEFVEDIKSVDRKNRFSKQWVILLHNTPLRAMPCTPSAHWKMSYDNYRKKIAERLRQKNCNNDYEIYKGNNFYIVESMSTDSLSKVILDAIILRGIESDASNIKKIAASSKFWRESTAVKQATLEKYFDTKLLFSEFERGKEPTSYLKSYWNQ